VLTGQAGSRLRLQPPEKESKPLCSVISNPCAQHLKLFRVRTQEKSCCDAKLSRVAGFRTGEFAFCILSICQSWPSCRNVPFAMSSREVNIRALQRSWTRPPKFATPLPRPADAQVRYSCPTCGSENTRRLSTAYMSGVSQFSATTSGFGWAGGPAGGSGWTTGTCQTTLSQISAPPRKRSYRTGLLLLFFGPVIGALPFAVMEHLNGKAQIHEVLAAISVIMLELCAVVFLGRAAAYNRSTWPESYREWQITWICLRCTQIFLPVTSRRE